MTFSSTLMATELLAYLMGCVMAKRVELLFLASGLTTGGQGSLFGLIFSIILPSLQNPKFLVGDDAKVV